MRKERVLPIVVGLLLAAAATAQDRSKYYTNQHPEEFLPLDWIAFYDEIDAGTAATRKELPVWSKYSNAQRVSSLHVYHHHERNHPGKENLLLFPASNQLPVHHHYLSGTGL